MNLKSLKAKKILNFITHRFLTAWQSFEVRKNNRLIPLGVTILFTVLEWVIANNQRRHGQFFLVLHSNSIDLNRKVSKGREIFVSYKSIFGFSSVTV